ncbi:hypothetical protein [Speluncibacter jeojiensis]|uniref:DUF7159 domain-containing protein n=1 Tax=Speluncibacter jeojiensis TaxID=2710754 RepID=A0A9X4M3Y6_9ACTN|nr:hypothetical protein [Corynebacteriales bacterium D3-21]
MSAILGASADIGAVRMTLGWDTPDAREWLPSALETQYIVPGVNTPAGMEAAAVGALQSVLAATPEVGTVVLACQSELQRRGLKDALAAREMVGVRIVGVVEAVTEYLRVTGWLESVDSFALLHAGYSSSSVSAVDAHTGAVLAAAQLQGGQLRRMNRDGGQTVGAVIADVLARAEWRPQALVVLGEGASWSGLREGLESVLPLPVMTPPAPELVLARGAALLGIPESPPVEQDPWFEEVHAPVLAPERRKGRRQSSGFGVVALMAAGFLAAGTVSAILMFSGIIGQREVGHTSPISAEPPQTLATIAPTVKPAPTTTKKPRPTPTTTTTAPPTTTTPDQPTSTTPPPPPPRPGLQLPALPRIELPPLPTLPPLQLPKLPR